ncbi:insulinase family protein [Parashewanella spongiae]|uniref:Protease 3 n=1 Tax=Parashewanella spongiae TaxID=342950 RepID=A0A3A6UB21_9GAMM|nr:insulinase family protein [Parashewanella spongiae]MCL1076900.1 insulinase family protein [Parashewanella spongiae]RJY19181.1 insulinase family protein [Parashewanella spongiae]
MPIDSVIQSPNDHRSYRSLTLNNGLKVLLVEDNKITQSAISLTVAVGHFDDPKNRPGMAHFLEHMLFLGTEKFPDAGEYHSFINHHGGSHNAWTGTEHTNFYCSVETDALESLLDRFSQFFIAPLFNPELVDRERHAIESEFSLKLNDDLRRIYDVEKETCNQAHPLSKFSVGNLSTLSGNENDLREELLSFYHKHYSANLMTVCLVAPICLHQQQEYIQHFFSDVPNHNYKKNYPSVPLYNPENLANQITICPVKKQKRLNLSFAFPSIEKNYPNKPLTFISHLLGNESKGSLLSYLKDQGLVNNLTSGGGVSGYNFKDFAINFQLTDKGLENVDDIVQSTFEFLVLIQASGIEQWRYLERSNLLKQAFEFQEQANPIELASHLSLNLQHYPPQDVIFGDYRMDKLDVAEVNEQLERLNCDNMRIQIVAQGITTSNESKWYKTPYKVEAICPQRLSKWKNGIPRTELQLPEVNPFVLSEVKPRSTNYQLKVPIVISENKGYRFWYKKDETFNLPKGHIYLAIDSLHACNDVRQAALTRLYIEMLLDYLTEHTYAAEVAGLNFNIYPNQAGLTLHISGFTPKQRDLLTLIINKAKERNFSEDRFKLIKKQILRNWNNISKTRPISQLFSSLTATIQQRSYEPLELANELETASLDELHQHVRNFYEATYLEGLIYGDWLKEEAQELSNNLSNILSLVSIPSPEANRELIKLTNRGTLVRQLNIDHQDSAILVYYQSKQTSILKMALFSLLNHTMSSKFFHELRTRKQLGYMVGTNYLPLNRHPGMIFYIQSPNCGPKTLLNEIDTFLSDFAYTVMELTEQQWAQTKQGLTNQIMEHDPNLKTRGQRFWTSIGNKDHKFDHREQVVNEINHLTRADLIKFLMDKMNNSKKDRLILYSCGQTHLNEHITKGQKIDTSITDFKSDSKKFKL